MSTGKRIIKNSAALFFSHIITKIINLAILLIITRLLGKGGFGVYSFSQTFVIMFMALASLGVNALLTRDVARDKQRINAFLGNSIPLITVFTGISIILINLTASLSGWEGIELSAIRIFSVYLIFDVYSRHFISVFRAFEKMQFEAYVNIIEKSAMLIAAIIAQELNLNLLAIIWIFTCIQAGKAVVAFIFMRRFFQKIEWHFFSAETKEIIKQAFPFALLVVFGVISGRIDVVMLKIFHSDEMVGLYSAAHKLIESMLFIPENIVSALFPAFAVMFVKNDSDYRKIFRRAFLFLTILAVPASIGIFLLAPEIIDLFFAAEYVKAANALRWLGLAVFFIFIKYIFSTSLNAIGEQKKFAIIMGFSMIVNIVLNLVLIPKYDLAGAGLATVASEFCAVIALVYFVFLKTKYLPPIQYILKPVSAGIIMGGVILLMRGLNTALIITVAAVVYFGSIITFKTFSFGDISYLKGIFLRRTGLD